MEQSGHYHTVLFDFDGVLSHDYFYKKTLVPGYPKVYDWIQSNVFLNKNLLRDWMRNRVDSDHINRLCASNNQIEFEKLSGLFEDSVRQMELDQRVLNLARQLKALGYQIGIVTNNMNVFSKILVPLHHLDAIFHVIVNSSDYGLLKMDENGRLFDFTLEKLNARIEDALLIDDSIPNVELFKQKGGHGLKFQNFEQLTDCLKAASSTII